MSTIATEDIGLADPAAISVVTACWTAWERIYARTAKGRLVDRNLIGQAVLYLCRAPKSKEVDTAMNMVVERRERGWHLDVPPEALDLHTQRGRSQGKGVIDWWRDTAWLPPGGHGKYADYARLKAAGGDLPSEQP